MIGGARAHGLDVPVEAYPYVAGMTALKSAFFNPGWQQRVGITAHEIALPETGERLTPASFARYRAQPAPRLVLIYMNRQEVVDAVSRDPQTMIATDAVMQDGKGHPRAAGTFARVLAHYVRTERMLPLIEAVRKMSLMPAQRLETMLPEARRKGRLQVGADADIDVFDLATVSDRATYTAPAEPSVGFRFVLVNGTLVVRDGQVLDARPGRALRRQEGE
jgi:N-acyl-D-aspartate/D-glutamate deacylase